MTCGLDDADKCSLCAPLDTLAAMARNRPDPWSRSPDDSGDVAPAARIAADEPEGIDALRARVDRIKPLLRRMRRHWRIGIIGFLIALAGVCVVAVGYKPVFLSEAVVFHEPSSDSPSLSGGPEPADTDLLRQLLWRRSTVEALIGDLKLRQRTVREHGIAVAVEDMRKAMTFSVLGTRTFRIGYKGNSPEEARDVTKWLIDKLVTEDVERHKTQSIKSQELLADEVKRAAQHLRDREEAMARFLAEHPEFSVAKPNAPKARAPVEVDAEPALVAERRASMAALSDATRRLSRLHAEHADEHPSVIAAQARVAEAEARLHRANEAIARQIGQANAQKPKAATTAGPAPQPKPRRDEQLAPSETDWPRLRAELDAARDKHERLTAQLFRADVSSRSQPALHDARVVVLDEAFLPPKPIRSRLSFFQLGLPAAAFFAFLLSLAAALWDDRIYDVADLQNLGIEPVLTVIPSHARNIDA